MAQWDAFISYARSASTLEAQKLQTAIQTFAKPWHRLRAVRIFRDDSSMSANPALWSTIEQGLREARWLVVLLSPAAARSEYVANEIRWWLQHKDAAAILLVHDEGTLAWDRVRNDFSDATDCVPAPLRGAFREEPRWSDLSWFDEPGSSGPSDPRFRERVADLASAIRGIPRDELLGDDVTQHRRSWRLAKLAIGGLSLLLIASVVASIIAIAQRNEVARQANSLLARQLAATADTLLTRDLRRAQLLAVRAYRTDPTSTTRSALLRAGLASPALRRVVPFDAPISTVEASADGSFVAVGLVSGEVFGWNLAAAAPVARFRMPNRILAVGVSNDGTVLAATDGTSAYATASSGLASIALSPGRRPQAIAVSPSGKGVAVSTMADQQREITLVDLPAGRQSTVPDPLARLGAGTDELRFLADDRLLVEGGGGVEVRGFPGFARQVRGEFSYGNHQLRGRLSGDGRFATATNGEAEVPVWSVTGDPNRPTRYAYLPMTNAAASALDHDAGLLAVADADGIHIATVRETRAPAGFGHPVAPPMTLVGLSEANWRGLIFLGGTRRLLAASGSDLSLWDPDSVGRSATSDAIELPFSCVACQPPIVQLAPDGAGIAVLDGLAGTTSVRSVPGQSGALIGRYAPDTPVGSLAPPLWLAEDTVLQLASGSRSGTLDGALPGLPEGFTGWAIGRPDVPIVALRASQDGATVLVVAGDGWIGRYQARTGQLLAEARMPGAELVDDVGISPDLATLAVRRRDDSAIVVIDAATVAERFRVGSATRAAEDAVFGTGSLWIRYAGGEVESMDPHTGTLQRRLPGRFFGYGAPVASDALLAIPTDVGVSLYDIADGAPLGTVDFPADRRASKRGIGLSADGSRLVTVFEGPGDDDDGLVVGTVLDPENLVATACRTSGGALSPEDWRLLVGGDPPADLTCR